jgi:hypothetical protein
MQYLQHAGHRFSIDWKSQYPSNDSFVGTMSSDLSDDDNGKKRTSFEHRGGEVLVGVNGDKVTYSCEQLDS